MYNASVCVCMVAACTYMHTYIDVSLMFNAYMLCICELAGCFNCFGMIHTYVANYELITDSLALHKSMEALFIT